MRLEKALSRLQSDKVIVNWYYARSNESILGQKGCSRNWLTWKILIEPPAKLIEHYGKIALPDHKKFLLPPSSPTQGTPKKWKESGRVP